MFRNLPQRHYGTLVIDPPWPIRMAGGRKRRPTTPAALPYRTATLDEIKAFPLADLAGQGAHVYCWATNATLRAAFDVLDAWGVRPHLTMPLVKRSGLAPANGYVFGSEFCLLGFFGRPMQPFTDTGRLNWLMTNPSHGRHSVKPDEFYSLVEAMSPAPRIDLFARRHREGWDVWGDELGED